MEQQKNMVVYYDEAFAASWLTSHAAKIRDFFVQKGFTEKSAHGLGKWINERIRANESPESCAVFSNDIMPNTVLRNGVGSANALIRRYLDAGGRIVWLGDIPFWSRAKPEREEIGQYGTPQAFLGALPLIAESSTNVEWIPELSEKMKSSWYSMRPINIEKESKVIGLQIKPLAFAKVMLSPCSYNALVIARWKKTGKRIGSIQLGIVGQVGITLTEKYPQELGLKKPLRLACSWQVIFNYDYPHQGFYRMFDCKADNISLEVLKDAYILAISK